MTVGYGDITPKNYKEVMIVSMVQIFGIIMFGYMISEIGYCISSLRRDRQVMEKDLFVVQKLKKHYKMNQTLTNKVRSYIMHTKPRLDQVSPDEEKGILIKLNEQIREDIVKQNLASVVRSSIFFLCRWSKNFQNSISNRLIHLMINPDDILYQPRGKQRIYIIKSGKIHIYAQKIGNKVGMNRPLKEIETKIEDQVTDNCYGYSSAISRKESKVYAMSKDFTSCYYIQRPSFEEFVLEKLQDIQYYTKQKAKLLRDIFFSLMKFLLQSSKHHYQPSKIRIIEKEQACDLKNKRVVKTKRRAQSLKFTSCLIDEQTSKKLATLTQGSFGSFLSLKEPSCGIEQPLKLGFKEQTIKFVTQNQSFVNLHHEFQQNKEYSNYFIDHNQAEIHSY